MFEILENERLSGFRELVSRPDYRTFARVAEVRCGQIELSDGGV